MIELHLDLKFIMEPWKKALAFGFLSYLIVLFILIVIVIIIKKDDYFRPVSIISIAYMSSLTIGFYYMYNIFKSKHY